MLSVMFVCLSVCQSVCLSVCVCLSVFLSIQAITYEYLHIETSFLVCRYIFTISRSSLSIKVIGSILCMWLQLMNKVKFTHQSEGYVKVEVKLSTSLQILCSSYSQQAGGLHSTECILVISMFTYYAFLDMDASDVIALF